jgi:tetratricopeptide (TPR) repeat protein
MRVALIQRFLNADRLVLRTLAARALQPVREQLSARRQADLDAAIAEYLDVQRFNSDRPEGMLNLANFELDRGRVTEAEDLYREAIARYPQHPAIYANLADLYRLTDRAEDSEATLREGLAASPGTADLELALGFAIVRRGAPEEALAHFRSAAGLAADDPYYSYVRAIAENDVGNAATALELLRATQQRFPGHGATLFALATMLRDAGDFDAARDYASRLVAVLPGDADALSLLRDLEQL